MARALFLAETEKQTGRKKNRQRGHTSLKMRQWGVFLCQIYVARACAGTGSGRIKKKIRARCMFLRGGGMLTKKGVQSAR